MTIQVTGRFQDSELAGKFSALLELTRREYEAARKHGREQDFVASVAGLIEDATWDMLNVGVPTLEYKPIDHAAYARDRVENGLDIEPTAAELEALDQRHPDWSDVVDMPDPDADWWQYEEPVGLQPISDSADPDEREDSA